MSLLSATAAFWGLADGALCSWDEALTAVRSAGMHERPALVATDPDGAPVLHKPPLLYWLGGLSIECFGSTHLGVRFPSALFGALGPVVVYLLGRRFGRDRGRSAGLWSAMFLLSSPQWWNQARQSRLDTAFAVFVVVGLGLLLLSTGRSDSEPKHRARTRTALLAGLSLGLAALSKNPLSGLALLSVRPQRLLSPTWSIAAVGFLVLGGSWYVAASIEHGEEFLGRFFGEEAWGRLTTPVDGHDEDLGYYHRMLAKRSYVLYFGGLAAVVLGAVFKLRVPAARPFLRFTAIWLLLLHLATTKLNWYLLPAFPTAALASGLVTSELLPRLRANWNRWCGRPLLGPLLFYAGVTGFSVYGLFLDERRIGSEFQRSEALEDMATRTASLAAQHDLVLSFPEPPQVLAFWTGRRVVWTPSPAELREALVESRRDRPAATVLVYARRDALAELTSSATLQAFELEVVDQNPSLLAVVLRPADRPK